MTLSKWELRNLVSFYGESDGGDVCDYEEGLEEGFDQVLIWFGTGEEANQRRRKKKMKKSKEKDEREKLETDERENMGNMEEKEGRQIMEN